MSNGYFKVEMPKNEPVKAYLPGSPERASLKKELIYFIYIYRHGAAEPEV